MAEEVQHGFWGYQPHIIPPIDLGIKKTEKEVKGRSLNNKKKKPTLDQFLRERYTTRRNLINKEIEIKVIKPSAEFKRLIPAKTEWMSMDDTKLNQLFFDAKLAGVKYLNSTKTIKDKLNSGFSIGYNPMLDYVNSLSDWDGRDYITEEFNKRVKAKNQDLAVWMFKKWFVGMVATALGKVVKTNETALILKGRQNLGKTRFINMLLPKKLREYMMSGILNPNDKDHLFRLATNFIYNLDELASMKASNVEKFKNIMSNDFVKARRVWAHYDTNEKVICSFTGTVNDEVFLHDLTGNRRYLVVDVQEVDATDNMPHDKMFKQAMQLNEQGFEWWFTDKDLDRMKEHTDNYRFKSPIEELIQGRFCPAKDKEEADNYLNATEILNALNNDGIQVSDTNCYKLGRIMASLDFKTKKINGSKKYALDSVKKSEDLIKQLTERNDGGYENLPY